MPKKSNKNIVIVGMMGVGKSSVGKVLAKELQFQFFDSDNEIENASNLNISKFLRNMEKIILTYETKYNRKNYFE